MSETALQRTRKRYTEEEIEAGINALVWCAGNFRHAAERVRDAGFEIPEWTLRHWKDRTHAQRYEETRTRLLPRLQKRMAQVSEDLAAHYAEAELAAVGIFMDKKDALEAKDAGKAAQQFAVARGISTEKGLLLRGQPTSISEQRPTADLLREMRRRLGDVDSTATEIADAEVVGDEAEGPVAVPAMSAQPRTKRAA